MRLASKAGIKGVVGILLVFALQVLLSSCDATAILYVDQVKWDKLHVLSAVPVKKEAGDYVPVCRSTTEDPVGLQLNVLFQGTTKKGDSGEKDISIKPFDLVDNQTIDPAKITPELFELDISCLEAYPDDNLYQCSNAFSGGDDLPIDRVDFFNYHQPELTNNEDIAVAVLMDISGSMNGLVMPLYPFNEDSFAVVSSMAFGTSELATDPKNARYGALESFIKTLNDDDAMILFAFNESGIDVVCEIPGQSGADRATKLEECFSSNRDLITGKDAGLAKTALESLQGEEKGRTPLWSAIEEVYPYMQGRTDEAKEAGVDKYKLRHILVIGDGPDTCAPSPEQNQCSGGCVAYSTSYETVRDLIEADPMTDRVPIHFVQMAAKGYPQRDPRQQEVACLTGGHHNFVNTQDIPGGVLQDVLTQTINRIRYTFRGYWRFEVPLGTVKKANEPPLGWLYGLTGGGRVLRGPEAVLVGNESNFIFKVNDDAVAGTNSADKRISFRKECDPDAASVCPGSETFNECSSREWWCDAQTLTCLSANAWTPNGEKSSCKPQDVYISLETRIPLGTNTDVQNNLFKIENVETRCCRGGCMPPNPPEVPASVAKPDGMASACFWYDENKGWILTNPAQFDRTIVECVKASDCGDGYACVANGCVFTCVFESDCADEMGAGYECSQSKCVKSCAGDGDCPNGWACSAGKCAAKACTTDDDCGSGYACDGELCLYDFDDENALAWIYFGTLNVKEGCQLEDFEPHLSKYESTAFAPEDWSHCTSAKNCFQPPVFETEAPTE